jgi:hypothetical protein
MLASVKIINANINALEPYLLYQIMTVAEQSMNMGFNILCHLVLHVLCMNSKFSSDSM